jgi:predicted dehydrogenase
VRLGIIGCGGMASSHMAGLLTMKESDNVEIAAVCDIYQKRLDAFAQKTGAQAYRALQGAAVQEGVGLCAHRNTPSTGIIK